MFSLSLALIGTGHIAGWEQEHSWLGFFILWGKSVHYDLTFRLSREQGLSAEEAAVVAQSCYEMDRRYPIGHGSWRNYWLHFDPLSWLPWRTDSRWSRSRRYLAEAQVSGDLRDVGMGIHCLQDLAAHQSIPFQKEIIVLGLWLGDWRDDPKKNKSGLALTEKLTRQFIGEYLQG